VGRFLFRPLSDVLRGVVGTSLASFPFPSSPSIHRDYARPGATDAGFVHATTAPAPKRARRAATSVVVGRHAAYAAAPPAPAVVAAASACAAAQRPETTALSIVAGRPVWIQSPASATFASGVAVPGRARSAAGVSDSVACRSRTTWPRAQATSRRR